jgi:hypothetical protein
VRSVAAITSAITRRASRPAAGSIADADGRVEVVETCALCDVAGRLEHLNGPYLFCDACGFVYAVDDEGRMVNDSEEPTQRTRAQESQNETGSLRVVTANSRLPTFRA